MAEKKTKGSKKKDVSPKNKGREIHETFEVIKKGKKKTIIADGFEEEKDSTEKQIKIEDKILKNIFIFLGLFVVAILLIYSYSAFNKSKSFDYNGVHFKIVKFCDTKPCLILYQTAFPVIKNGKKAEYNFYLRKDPRGVNVPFNGSINLQKDFNKNLMINITNNLNCKGDAVIALGNIVKFYDLFGVKFVRNGTSSCNPNGKNIFLNIQQGNKTNVEQTAPSCYKINIKKCEILDGTEKFLVESFIQADKMVNKKN